MTLLHAFVDQILFGIFGFIMLYPKRKDLPDSFWATGIYFLVFMHFVFGTWFRYVYQLPLIGAIGYLFE